MFEREPGGQGTTSDIADLLDALGAAPLELARAIIENARDIIMLVAFDGTVLYANPAAERAYGIRVDELEGMSLRDLRDPDTLGELEAQMSEAAEGGILFETTHVRADGTAFPVEVNARAIPFAGQSALLSIVRDITNRRAREDERERLLEDLALANARTDSLLRIVTSALGSLDLDDLLCEVVHVLRDVTDADAALVFLHEGSMLKCVAEEGAAPLVTEGWTIADDEGFAGRVVASKSPVVVGDVMDADFAMDVHRAYAARTMFGVPLLLDGEVVGVVECAWRAEREISDAEQSMLEVAADRIATAIEGAQRYELTRRAERLNAALNEVSSLVNSSLQPSQTLPSALELSAFVLDADVGAFGSVAQGVWEALYTSGMEAGRRAPLPMHAERRADPAGRVPVVSIGPGSDHAEWFVREMGFSEGLIAPVQLRGEWFGALVFGRETAAGGFDETAEDFVRRLSSVVSFAYANFSDFESEHRIAETLQEALLRLPERVDGIAFGHLYSSATVATRVGGDFYDLFTLPDGRVAALVGDVSGKGLDAAVLTSVIKDTVRAYAHEADSPAVSIAKANLVLRAAARLPDFASVFFLVLDPRSGEVTFCCAGHPPAIIVRDGGEVEELDCGSPVIGAFFEMNYTDDHAVLNPGDVLVLYTDGITEARAADGAFFGEAGLVSALRELAGLDVADLPGALADAVRRFTGGMLRDDVAVLALRTSHAAPRPLRPDAEERA